MDIIREWLIGITCAAMVVALAESMTPEGTVKRVGRLIGGLVLMLAVISPLVKIDYNTLSGTMAEYRTEIDNYTDAFEGANRDITKAIIAEQTSAYILDKAISLGVGNCKVEVTCEYGDGEFPVPVAVHVTGTFNETQQLALSRAIEADFAIPVEGQTLERTDET